MAPPDKDVVTGSSCAMCQAPAAMACMLFASQRMAVELRDSRRRLVAKKPGDRMSADELVNMQRVWDRVLSTPVLAVLSSPSLGPCKVRQLDLSQQKGLRGVGGKVISPERFPGASSPLLLLFITGRIWSGLAVFHCFEPGLAVIDQHHSAEDGMLVPRGREQACCDYRPVSFMLP